MSAVEVDYSLYLVTDSTPAILGGKDIIAVVEAALEGGVTVVQYRDKVSDTAVLVSTARKLHAVTQKYSVPLLINDRVDVALAVGCEGVHIGQDDLGTLSNAPSEALVELCRSQKRSTPSRRLGYHRCDSVLN
jgi:thiamine-phosphate diphosphorylase/hydroxyethylthiazole kinase